MANATLPFFAASGSPSVLGTVDQSYFSGFLASHGLMQPDTPSIDAFYGLLATASAAFGGGALGDYLVFLLFTVFPFKIFRTLGIWFFLWADRTGFLDAYRIQDKGRQPSPAQVDAMYKAQVSNWHLGFLLVELPLTTAFYLLRVSLGYSIHSRDPGGWSQVAWKFVWALIVYDTWVWAWHVACHVSPYMYKRFHKQHHEHVAPMIMSSAYFEFVDLMMETTLGVYSAHLAANSSFLSATLWMSFMSWIGVHNHCGFACPWDVVNMIFRYVEYHDYHHSHQDKGAYQTVLVFWDWLFGWDKGFWAHRKARLEAKKAGKGAKAN